MALASLGRVVGRGIAAGLSKPSCRVVSVSLPAARLVTRASPSEADAGFEDDYDGETTAAVQRRVLKLKDLQEKYDTINREYQKELATLQARYEEQYKPVFDQRSEVVAGKVPVDKYDVEDDGEPDKGIPEFWLEAFLNHDKVGPYITDKDAEVLASLVDVRSKVLTSGERGFELTFHFKPNEYFEQTVLTKKYVLEPEEDIIPKAFIGCEIKWKSDSVNPTVEVKKKRVKGSKDSKGGKPAFTMETQPTESFFNIFDPPQIPEQWDEDNQEELDAIQEELSADFDIGFAIKEQIVPRAVEWFTGELSELPDEGEWDEGEFEEDEPLAQPPTPSRGDKGRR